SVTDWNMPNKYAVLAVYSGITWSFYRKGGPDGIQRMEKEIVLGIDIGGTYTKLGLVTQKGEILSARKFATGAKEPFGIFEDRLHSEIAILTSELDASQDIMAIGVGAPNANAHTGQMEHPANFRWGDAVPLVSSVKKVYNVPV